MSRTTREELNTQINYYKEAYCSGCRKKDNPKFDELSDVCRGCTIGRRLNSLGDKLLKHDEFQGRLSKDQIFYLVNHVDVLGLERGVEQSRKHIERDPYFLELKYYEEKKKTRYKAM